MYNKIVLVTIFITCLSICLVIAYSALNYWINKKIPPVTTERSFYYIYTAWDKNGYPDRFMFTSPESLTEYIDKLHSNL